MLNKKNKVSETMICRYIYITLTLIVVSNVIAFPCLSLFPFQWALILGALFINTFTNKMPLKCITVIIILLSSVAVFFMDIVGSLFFNQNVWLLSSLSFFSILNMLVSVKILIDMLTILSLKYKKSLNINETIFKPYDFVTQKTTLCIFAYPHFGVCKRIPWKSAR